MISDIILFGLYSIFVTFILYAILKEHEEWEAEYRFHLYWDAVHGFKESPPKEEI